MAVKKTKKKSGVTKALRASTNGKPPSYLESIRRHLSAVSGLDAVYTWVDSRRIVHVVSVVNDHDSELYEQLIPKEDLVEEENPRVFFDFHVRARQKRKVEDVIPTGGNLVFKK